MGEGAGGGGSAGSATCRVAEFPFTRGRERGTWRLPGCPVPSPQQRQPSFVYVSDSQLCQQTPRALGLSCWFALGFISPTLAQS